MKKIYLYLTVALATFAIIISCSKEQGTPVLEESTDAEEVIIPEEGVDGLITLTFTAEYPTPIETKTTVTEEGVVAWEKDDQITLYYLEDGQPKSVNATALASGSTQCETLILTDEMGNPVRKAIVWLDNRATKEAEEIEAHFGRKRVYEVTGQPEVTATWPASKLL